MIILYIAGINDNKSAGPNTNIPKNIFYGSKYETIGIYNIYETTADDADYFDRDTAGKREVSLSTCTDNSKARLVIWAAE